MVQQRGMAHGRRWMEKRGRNGFKKRTLTDVVLVRDTPGLGVKGQVVSVAHGYAMNHLVRVGKGEVATKLNRALYEKPLSELGDVQASESALLSRVKVLAKRIENTEVLIKRFQTSKGMEVTPFHMVGVLNHMRKMNVPPFTVKKIQPIVEDEDEVKIFTRKAFDTKLKDFDALKLGEELRSTTLTKPGKYVATLELSEGLDIEEPVFGKLRVTVDGHGESLVSKKDGEKKVPRSTNPRKQLYRFRKGMTNANWSGWDGVKITK